MKPTALTILTIAGLSAVCALTSGCGVTMQGAPGASVAWTRYEAENAAGNTDPVKAARTYLTPEAEAAGRRFVRLTHTGDYVEFTADRPANGLVLRYSLPDSEDGGGLDATLGLYLNGRPAEKLRLTSRFAWVYGNFPWTNQPSAGRAHHFFDETQVKIPPIQPGDTVRLQVDADDHAAYYLIDFVELETVEPPIQQPEGSLSITDFGASPDDGTDDAGAFLQLIDAAKTQDRIAWIPEGSFILNGSFKGLGSVDLRGAGMWHTRLIGDAPMFYGYGEPFSVSDLAIFGPVDHRNDMSPDNAFNGNLGEGTKITRVWIEHMKCGLWSTHGTRGLQIRDCRIRNTMADGINLCDGTTDSVVENCHLRNTGDDALATWSPSGDWSSRQPCERNRFVNNTIESPWHANGIGVYGGRDHEVRGNLVIDTVFSGGGLLISSGHGALPFAGSVRAENNRFVRTGGDCYIGEQNGGMWLHAVDSDIAVPVVVRDLAVIDSGFAGITIHGPRSVRQLTLENVRIRGSSERGILIMPGSGGADIHADALNLERIAADTN